ncbi:MAG: sodium:solute symporter [Bacteroidetes bacterium]|nr:MAG: sodium:solute symporter [Bacteroidota bacterium]MBL1145843.1 sodium:solute symporter [Bacteroidota bacterium]NOG58637.1 sodium:solute symporter [Bacteroidota bacterium]
MSPISVVGVIAAYFSLLVYISFKTSKGANNESFFIGNKNSPWYLVAFGMIGTSLSGVTFISVPGWVQSSQFSYMQMVLGYLFGYSVIALVLLPLYYKLNLTSIYTYLEKRLGFWSYKTGAFYFLLSRLVGASFRLYLVANVLQLAVFDAWNIPYWLTVAITILLIWVYTFKGGIKTIVWTDSLQTFFMLLAVGITIYSINSQLNFDFNSMVDSIKSSEYSKVFFFDDWRADTYFWKQFLGGVFISIVMTGLDQDMMQKNLSCRNIREAQKNMFSFSLVLVFVNLFFLCLGALLFIYSNANGIEIPSQTDDLYPLLAIQGYLGPLVSIFFILGLIAAAYSSADSALTALTTSVCIDFLSLENKPEPIQTRIRRQVHIIMSVLLFVTILIFNVINNDSVISSLFKAAGYTYGPLLGMFAFGLYVKRKVNDKLVPLICFVSPFVTYILNEFSIQLFNGYKFGFEIILLNGFLAFMGLLLISKKEKIIVF